MSDLLRDYQRKRGRAMLHFDVLREQVKRLGTSDRERVKGEFQPDASKYVFKVPLKPLDASYALLVGDFVYNVRASLDYLITALIRSTGEEEHDRSQFPIYAPGERVSWEHIHQWWDDSRDVDRMLEGTPAGTKAALKELQPFHGVPASNPLWHPLWVLYLLSNRDKHRRLNLLARNADVDFVDALGEPIFQGPSLRHRIVESGERDAYTVTLAVKPDYADMDMYLLATHEVALHEPPEVFGELIELLSRIHLFIDGRVLPTIKRLLP